MPITVNGIDRIKRRFARIQAVPKEQLGKLAGAAVTMIKDHTLAGEDEQGKKLRRYSKGYMNKLVRENRKKRGARPNLMYSGDMFRSLQWKVLGRTTAALMFTMPDEADKAEAHHKGLGHMPRRPFFGLQADEQQKLNRYLAAALKDALK